MIEVFPSKGKKKIKFVFSSKSMLKYLIYIHNQHLRILRVKFLCVGIYLHGYPTEDVHGIYTCMCTKHPEGTFTKYPKTTIPWIDLHIPKISMSQYSLNINNIQADRKYEFTENAAYLNEVLLSEAYKTYLGNSFYVKNQENISWVTTLNV